MTQPNPFLPQQPQAPAPQQQPQNPYAAPAQPQPGPQTHQNPYAANPAQYAAPASNGGSPWPQGATAGAPGLVAAPGQFMKPGAPPPPGAGNIPSVADLQGRLLIIMPERCDRNVPSKFPNDDGTPKLQDKMTATVVVLDGHPLQWGGSPTQAPHQAQIPHVIKGLWIQQKGLIVQLEDALNLRLSGGPGLALGRLWKAGTAKNDPYVLAEPQPQDVEIYNRYVSQVNPFAL